MRIAEVAVPTPLHRTFSYSVPQGLSPSPGARVRVPFGPRRLTGVVVSLREGEHTGKFALKDLDAVLDREPILPRELLELALWLAERCSAPVGECARAVLPAFVKSADEILPAPAPPGPAPMPPPWELTRGQSQALERITSMISARRHAAALLFGVPASGKTEVYLRLIRQVAAAGGQALFLLPEISLTRPFFDEFRAALRAPVALWHSRLTERERRHAWLGLKRGQVKVVVGARSAALLPFSDLRLVVLDEEQDESFKQEGKAPLYHARDVALHRARSWGAVAVLGSATPSLESWEAARRGELVAVAMPDRVSAVARPAVSVLPHPERGRVLSEALLEKLKERLARREQAILLVNRRGFTTLLMCGKCGWIDRCPSCGVAKIQHEAPGGFVLRCHHCSRSGPVPAACPQCKNPGLRAAGTGTQKVVAELKKALPGARITRMDSDTIAKERKADKRAYDLFKAGEADVLVGTKLVAKSFHFPDVTLVGVVDADTMLHMPDFRSSERTMQLLAQVAGRSGRAEKPGEVVLQTLHPEHIAIQGAVAGDYGAFADRELELRRELAYPPYSALVRLLWLGAKDETVAEAARAAAEALRVAIAAAGHEVVGPAPAAVPKASGKFRWHALVKVARPEAELPKLLAAARGLALPSTVTLKINVDPYDLF